MFEIQDVFGTIPGRSVLLYCEVQIYRIPIFIISFKSLIETRSTESMEFSNVDLWAIIEFLFLQKKKSEEIYESIRYRLGTKCPLYSTMIKWCDNL